MGKIRANPKLRRRIFLREWRESKNLSLEQVAEALGVTASSLSQTELGKTEYTRPLLEFLADLYSCAPGDLLMRDPSDVDAPWSIWDTLKPDQRKQAIRLLRALRDDETEAA